MGRTDRSRVLSGVLRLKRKLFGPTTAVDHIWWFYSITPSSLSKLMCRRRPPEGAMMAPVPLLVLNHSSVVIGMKMKDVDWIFPLGFRRFIRRAPGAFAFGSGALKGQTSSATSHWLSAKIVACEEFPIQPAPSLPHSSAPAHSPG